MGGTMPGQGEAFALLGSQWDIPAVDTLGWGTGGLTLAG